MEQLPEIVFPTDCCCNCGSSSASLAVLEQNTKLTRYYALFGRESTATLRLPFCEQCRRTADRRPASMRDRILTALLWTAIVFFIATFFAISKRDDALLARALPISAIGGVAITTIWYLTRRRRGEQTSYYQPVRIRSLERKPGSTAVGEMVVGFTSEPYLLHFIDRNFELVHQGRIVPRRER